MNAIRAFIAIELSTIIHQQLEDILKHLKSEIPNGVRWVPSQNIHLTLKFLGESSPANLSLLTKSLPAVTLRHAPFEFQVGTLGAFPNIRRPRVIWVGVQAPEQLKNLFRSIESETLHLGYPSEDRDFSPHLTLGRVNQSASPQDINTIASVLSQYQVNHLGSVSVRKVTLFRSELNPSGSVYTSMAVFPLSQ